MARPKRMGAYNALAELLPPTARLEPVPDPPAGRQSRFFNALDELLPGPRARPEQQEPAAPRLEPVPDPGRSPRRGRRQHLDAWNPLDGLPPPAADADPARTRVSFRLPSDLVEAARDAVAHLGGTPQQTTMAALAERGLRAELARLAAAHNRGRPFPRRARR
jgi:hypothetical protein